MFQALFSLVVFLVFAAAVAGVFALFVDLKIHKWDWTDQQRYGLIIFGVVVGFWTACKIQILWVHVITALSAVFFLLYTLITWRQCRKQGGNLTLTQLATKFAIIITSICIINSMIGRIL